MTEDAVDGSWSLADWVVLGLLVERPRHGFSLVKELGPDTLLGHVWTVPNPMVYRALRVLRTKGVIVSAPPENSGLGPRRTPMRPTGEGHRRFHEWVRVPVDHFRDVRVLLRVKLHLTVRLGLDPVPLLRAQHARFALLSSAIAQFDPPGSAIEGDLLRLWRQESTTAAQAFVDRALDALDPSWGRRLTGTKATARLKHRTTDGVPER